jgi:hypothetical protein
MLQRVNGAAVTEAMTNQVSISLGDAGFLERLHDQGRDVHCLRFRQAVSRAENIGLVSPVAKSKVAGLFGT